MCSILGYFNTALSYSEVVKQNSIMVHRGPDDTIVKEYKFLNKNLYFGHNRLSIQDLENHANQPMENERFIIVFNGEIYNHFEIRTQLQFSKFRTTSDTETILWAFTEFGIEKAIEQFIGMFAIGLFDKIAQKLYLIRDRVGIKPLYYTMQKGEFSFASELKGFGEHLKKTTSNKALIQFMTLGYIPNDNSYYDGINKLPPAHYAIFDGVNIDIKKYWDLPEEKINISYNEAVKETEQLIRSSIKYRLLADVEVGSFLSGGIDSSLVSSIMQQESSQKLKTFSIGFEDKFYDESVYAKEIAKYIGSEHYEYKFGIQDVFKLLEDFDKFYDEPFGDASSLPMLLLSDKTKDYVTVALSGDGGDELFLGYDRYFTTESYYKKLKQIPQSLRTILSVIGKYSGQDKLKKISYPLKQLSEQNLYALLYSSTKPWELNSLFDKEFSRESFGKYEVSLQDILEYELDGDSLIDSLSRLDFHRYLPDDILTKVDRASMSYSLEARVPLLDHRIVEFAYSLPIKLKLKHGPKSILKEILYKEVPKELIERPKRGFSVPLKHWFRKELKDIVYDKIQSLDERFNKQYLNKIFQDHQNGKNFEYVLWNIMRIK
ncbi:asparagine synthase (glutamine-hydrolyzing) [Arcobacter nitrofigilis DSM 7299]|uniref:asparagine synthase (glutamine-hydrolyzing) n=1 Tax=Arcobacter nitrofigilis (strain ATCC 33309 / DSM 7299 / CCUG 15893 / LMG 7604 / NCTC 12251 / CI) TaxID=572480 RepID=D5V6C6_ARCNC|nr:asparagine synthase (glutamine-hydrolyzing) [Arcobacter nitrofigilis]ADG94196.1 asparagine synthase (glutamine-hydrolyzing) [Arcobacter nitrofigilis DSM 7299]